MTGADTDSLATITTNNRRKQLGVMCKASMRSLPSAGDRSPPPATAPLSRRALSYSVDRSQPPATAAGECSPPIATAPLHWRTLSYAGSTLRLRAPSSCYRSPSDRSQKAKPRRGQESVGGSAPSRWILKVFFLQSPTNLQQFHKKIA